MKTVLLIGLGRFGQHVAQKLNDLGQQVMAVDSDEERVDAVLLSNRQVSSGSCSTRLMSSPPKKNRVRYKVRIAIALRTVSSSTRRPKK